jgi:hypothetical protein
MAGELVPITSRGNEPMMSRENEGKPMLREIEGASSLNIGDSALHTARSYLKNLPSSLSISFPNSSVRMSLMIHIAKFLSRSLL